MRGARGPLTHPSYPHSHTHSHIRTPIRTRSTKMGIYKEGCGLHNLMLAYGHDEYLYRVLVHNKTKIPEEGACDEGGWVRVRVEG